MRKRLYYTTVASLHRSEIVSVNVGDASSDELAGVSREWDVVVSCTGFATGRTQVELAKPVLQAGMKMSSWRGRDMFRTRKVTGWIIVSMGVYTSFHLRFVASRGEDVGRMGEYGDGDGGGSIRRVNPG
ncbi:hypothetical protein NEOLEDRAFT_1150629 [Neolentinus lepideus HHB14362 ss-1]|uniref:Uncharacterized protein n=1 Tax=Neolentinus lepideus HHB14362 ss-1 TaxID=1314782 RepID=A0A165PX71_9AGAM|nr:hypothetical protein NEOLEDRAFT_1150629 [Neolentinus lepideus HHB14362 ss-1]